MGSLRFFLALSVVFAHTGVFLGFALGDGRMAVQAFYMISGFYMSLVWTEKYSKLPNPIRTFYISRALRIYPLYFVVLAGVLLMGIVAGSKSPTAFHFSEAFNILGWPTAAWVYLTQLTLIGMETPLFLDFQLHKYMILPVAWTLGLELTFYLLVPFLLSRVSILVGVLTLSLMLRVWASVNGPTEDVLLNEALWSYRFFPFEIALFLAGALAYRLFAQIPITLEKLIARQEVYFLTILGIIGYLCYFKVLLPSLGEATYWLYYVMVFFGVSVLFQHTKKSKRDSYIGELSYPMYIVHIPILWVVGSFCAPDNRIYVVIPLTLLVSMLLSRLQQFIDDYRHALLKQARS
ncbi:MAG: acyltransferase [Sideroxydans sp.]|nr:acyltransferase [Sideroxydans sp.]